MQKLSIIFVIILFIHGFYTPLEARNPDNLSWKYYMEKGTIQFNAGMYEFSRASMERVLDLKKDHYPAMNILARLYLKKSNPLRALDWFKESVAQEPNQPQIHFELAKIHESLADTTLAFNAYRSVLRYDNTFHQAHTALVRFYWKKGNMEKVTYHTDTGEKYARAQFGTTLTRAVKLDSSGNDVEAMKLYTTLMKKAPALTTAFMRSYRLHMLRGHNREAVKVLEKLIHMQPNNERALLLLGELYYSSRLRIKRLYALRKSRDCYLKALKLNKNRSDTHIALIDVYRLLGNQERVEHHLEEAARLEKQGK